MKGFNLSEWAINHRPFVWFLMMLFVVAGVLSYRELGREEDPSFSIKTMIVRTYWPGATIDDTMLDHRPDRKETAGNPVALLPQERNQAGRIHDLRQRFG